MPTVTIQIHGQNYAMACDEGQEDRVQALGEYLDKRVKEIAQAGAANSDSHLLVLASLLIADELFDLKARQQNGEDAVPSNEGQAENAKEIKQSLENLGRIARKIDSLALEIEAVKSES